MKTTLEISAPLLRRAKKLAARDGTTLRALVEEGLTATLQSRKKPAAAIPPLLVVKGNGMNPEFAAGGWEKIRDTIYERLQHVTATSPTPADATPRLTAEESGFASIGAHGLPILKRPAGSRRMVTRALVNRIRNELSL